MKIIFVCTGNTCRSPMAEGFFNEFCKKNNRDDMISLSRGVFAEIGKPASENSIISASQFGADISSHTACQLTSDDIYSSDYIFTMTDAHKALILNTFPDFSQKVFSISEFASCSDISDPFGGDISVYRKCAKEIYDAVQKIYEKLNGK